MACTCILYIHLQLGQGSPRTAHLCPSGLLWGPEGWAGATEGPPVPSWLLCSSWLGPPGLWPDTHTALDSLTACVWDPREAGKLGTFPDQTWGIIQCPVHCTLFMRSQALSPVQTQGEGTTEPQTRACFVIHAEQTWWRELSGVCPEKCEILRVLLCRWQQEF